MQEIRERKIFFVQLAKKTFAEFFFSQLFHIIFACMRYNSFSRKNANENIRIFSFFSGKFRSLETLVRNKIPIRISILYLDNTAITEKQQLIFIILFQNFFYSHFQS